VEILKRILKRKEFIDNPPVLLDIGASGDLNQKWEILAPYSIGVAFDADDRDFEYINKKDSTFKQLYVFNSIVSNIESKKVYFHLTKSPHCSSVLEPNKSQLENWSFAELFDVDNKTELRNITLKKALQSIGIGYVDWFKSDSQGTDLRLFTSLDQQIQNKVLLAEFEPGILDAYKDEDKLFSIIQYFDQKNFWLSKMDVKSTLRFNKKVEARYFSRAEQMFLEKNLTKAPGWAEITYLNDFSNEKYLTKRDYLLGWIFSIIEEQLGFALEIATCGFERYSDGVFQEMKEYTLLEINFRLEDDEFYNYLKHDAVYTLDDEKLFDNLSMCTNEKEIFIFGAGSFGERVLEHLNNHSIKLSAFIDNDLNKRGQLLSNVKVVSLDDLPTNMFIIIASTWHKEIKQQLTDKGLKIGKDFLVVYI